MGYPVARVGNLVKVGSSVGKIINGAKAHTVDGSSGGFTTMIDNGLVSMFGDEDAKAMLGENSDDNQNIPAPEPDPNAPTDPENDTPPPVAGPVSCNGITGNLPPTFVLAPTFLLGNVSTFGGDRGGNGRGNSPPLYPHALRAQRNLSKAQIICHLKTVVNTCVVPIANHFGREKFNINSGFRQGNSASQHEKGMAVDLHFPGKTPSQLITMGNWIRQNIPHDQLILERANTYWIHISFDPGKSRQRGDFFSINTRNGNQRDGFVDMGR